MSQTLKKLHRLRMTLFKAYQLAQQVRAEDPTFTKSAAAITQAWGHAIEAYEARAWSRAERKDPTSPCWTLFLPKPAYATRQTSITRWKNRQRIDSWYQTEPVLEFRPEMDVYRDLDALWHKSNEHTAAAN